MQFCLCIHILCGGRDTGAAPILFGRKTSDGSGGNLEAVRSQDDKGGTGAANPAGGKTETPANTKGKTKSPSSAASASPAKPETSKKATSRGTSKATVKGPKPKGK
jgi:hypothetical protein